MRYCRLLSFFDTFSCQIWSSHICLKTVVKKLTESFFIVSSRVIITCIAKEYSREYFFLEGILSKQVTKSAGESWNNIKLTSGIFFSVMRVKRDLKSRKDLPVLGNTHTNCSFRTFKLTLFLTNNLFKFFLIYKSIKFFG